MPYDKAIMEVSLTKVMVMCHCPIGEAFHKLAFHIQEISSSFFWEWGVLHVKLFFTKLAFLRFLCMLAF